MEKDEGLKFGIVFLSLGHKKIIHPAMKGSFHFILPGLLFLLILPLKAYPQLTISEDRSDWIVTTEIVPCNLGEVNFQAGGKGVAIGKGYVLHTIDGGVTWTIVQAPEISGCIAFAIPDEDTAYALKDNTIVIKTIDGGMTWFSLASSRDTRAEIYTDLDMMDATNGMKVGFWVSPGGMGGPNARRTTDGTTWFSCAEQFNGMLTTVRFQDRLRGFITSDDYDTWLTSNGAVSFYRITMDTAGPVQDAWFIDQFTGYLILSDNESLPPLRAVLKTVDQGLNWTTVYLDPGGTDSRLFRRIWFQDELNGYIAGDGGLITRTRDGGVTWTVEESGTTNDFIDAFFHDTSNAVLVGQNGTIARKGLVFSAGNEIAENTLRYSLFPNPCKDEAVLELELKDPCRIMIRLKDPRGKLIRQICDREVLPGVSKVRINASELTPGLFFLHISGEKSNGAAKMVVIR